VSQSLFTTKKRIRQSFGKVPDIAEIPNLICVQQESYEDFLQLKVEPTKRINKGLESIFRSIFPISDQDGRVTLEYVKYTLTSPKYDINECLQRGVHYASSLIVTMRLIMWDIEDDTGAKSPPEVKSIKEQEVFMGEVPLMTETGTFIINGAQRVIVSQMHRSPGAFYFHDHGKGSSTGKYLYSSRIIPYRGSWLDFEFDAKDLLFFRIDKKRKLYVTTLLRALGYTSDSILSEFYTSKTYGYQNGHWQTAFDIEDFRYRKILTDIVDSKTHQVLLQAGTKITPRVIKDKSVEHGKRYLVEVADMIGKYIANSLIDPKTKEVLIPTGTELTQSMVDFITNSINLAEIDILNIDDVRVGSHIRDSLFADKNVTHEDALCEIYRVLRPGEPVTVEAATAALHDAFFNPDRYDLSPIGRMKINIKHNLNTPENLSYLRKEDIIAFIKHLVFLKDTAGEVDDIDSLSNRRLRTVGELVENQFRLGLIRMERSILEKMNSGDLEVMMPQDLLNYKALMSIVNEFFGTSQLSQFMDQVNPLAEVTHKRRVSALGPGGLMRERAGLEVRGVHPSHYGRICPLETPEGQNIGLISSLATYASVNKYGLIESAYRKVVDGRVTDEVCYLSAIEEEKYNIAQADASLKPDGSFANDLVSCRHKESFVFLPPNEIQYADVSPKQVVSVAASLIPFLENDDSNRALMGANMQRQAVPLLLSEAPLVGTGMEALVAKDSGAVVIAKRDGVVAQVDANRIVLKTAHEENTPIGVDIYALVKYQRSNQGNCINQTPIVKIGDIIKAGDIIADGSCTDLGELALGKNVKVAFVPWRGYNFEDSIVVSERVVQNDLYTSIHIKVFEAVVRDTRLGPEEITRDIPNVTNVRNLDEAGIIILGTKVQAGDILVGKVTPKAETHLTPEEKLLRAIFGEKATEVRDSSLYAPPGVSGTVIGIRIFTRRGVLKDERAIALERIEIEKVTKDKNDKMLIIEDFIYAQLENILLDQKIASSYKRTGKDADGKATKKMLEALPKASWWQITLEDQSVTKKVEQLKTLYTDTVNELHDKLKRDIDKIQSGEDLPQGALRVIKIYLATKLKLQPGDKMAGRHGNKGVVSKIVPVEDMPFLEDGTPVDIVLNPIGVPPRMNVGQILETHLGWACSNIGQQIQSMLEDYERNILKMEFLRSKLKDIYNIGGPSNKNIYPILDSLNDTELLELCKNLKKGVPVSSPVFDGAKESDIDEWFKKAGLDTSGQVTLFDGRTGEPFERQVTVGSIYMMKLDHLVEDKMHARSTGPYSLVTQQPLGGKAYFGGQRFGEMECWTLQAYGAARTLQEMLTVKSDDVHGRVAMYSSIIKGDQLFECGTPESFNVMVKELRSLALNVDLIEESDSGTTTTPSEEKNRENPK